MILLENPIDSHYPAQPENNLKMDTTKWKSVLVTRPMYEEISAVARIEARSISGQLRLMWEAWKRENLSKKDQKFLKEEIVARRNAESA